ncbi:FAD-dependent oxidoreductase [Streptomyces sp. TLI_171]|uniref:FAD-dependent oxidoreductase n=1 Tax=Streptomyces sp. TLI_171 TaxID=1938859 RepID=UPI000C1963DD|nr:FAD-dependent oxidoreductase [Streptomyces sp. TLI_171]RKE22624.1 pyridine nucleotide-disulfide oxidoreductase [Streptomyces sp. TLI_171]
MAAASTAVAVVGAGPYGLAVAAHLRARGVPFRVLGVPMESWRERMPPGMYLKSTPRASSISAPTPGHGFDDFRRECGEAPVDDRYAIPVDEFVRYGEWFRRRCVPEVEQERAVAVGRDADGMRVELAGGEVFRPGAVVLASGFPPYAWVPPVLREPVGRGLASHSSALGAPASFAGRRVAVVGAGQSALESATLLAEAGAHPVVVVRGEGVLFGTPPPDGAPRSAPARLRSPVSPLGPGWPLLAITRGPAAFRHLPDATRARLVRTVLGPAGAWWLAGRFEGRVPVVAGRALTGVEEVDGGVRLRLSGTPEPVEAEHVVVATGYRVDVGRLELLDPPVREALRTHAGSPRLSAGFESSVPGLYFAGLAAADTFGPVMRFVCGTGFAARRLSDALARGTMT